MVRKRGIYFAPGILGNSKMGNPVFYTNDWRRTIDIADSALPELLDGGEGHGERVGKEAHELR